MKIKILLAIILFIAVAIYHYDSEYLCDGVWFPVRCEAWKE